MAAWADVPSRRIGIGLGSNSGPDFFEKVLKDGGEPRATKDVFNLIVAGQLA
jgi:hypothetical protein